MVPLSGAHSGSCGDASRVGHAAHSLGRGRRQDDRDDARGIARRARALPQFERCSFGSNRFRDLIVRRLAKRNDTTVPVDVRQGPALRGQVCKTAVGGARSIISARTTRGQ